MDDKGILDAIDRACVGVDRETERRIKEAEAWRGSELARFERARCALTDRDEPVSAGTPKPTRSRPGPRGRVRRKRLSPASPEELAERCDKVARLIEESTDPLSFSKICRALGLSGHMVRTAIRTLKEEGRIKSDGTGSATRYTAANRGSGPLARQAPTQGTLEERIVIVLEDRHQATAQELAQALREPLDRVVAACGRLQGEERIQMSRINDRPAYRRAVRV